MKTVMLRNVEVGCGKPKVIVPIVAATAQGILEKAREFRAHALDVVEWRVDFYEDVFQLPKVLSTLKGLREILGETPILFTFRTRKEGGEKEIDMEAYTALNTAVAQSGDADAVDVEVFSGDEVVRRNIQAIHAAGKAVVGSNHDFGGTPDKADLLFRLRKMQELGADNIYRILLRGRAAQNMEINLSELTRRYCINEVIDKTECDYDMDELHVSNHDNLLGRLIDELTDDKKGGDKAIRDKALHYCMEALLGAGEK